ncbi:Ankyrin repeat-containing domain [Phytophthora cactorum]|nr:Ankyrin repeat-containing domain [Phytophthora cactorum]
MQLQLVSGDDLDVLPSSQAKQRPMRDFEAASSVLSAPRRAELSRQRHCVDFEHQTIELRQAFRTAPEPVTLEREPADVERSVTCSEDSEAPKEKQLKKKKKVSFLQTEPEQELEQSYSNQCSCQSLKPSDNAKDMPSPIHAACRRAELQALKHLELLFRSTLQKACSAAAVEHPELIRVLLGEGKNAVSKQNVVICAFDAVNLPDYRLMKCLAKMYDPRLLLEARDKTSQSSLLHAAVKNGSAKTVLLLSRWELMCTQETAAAIPPLYLACARGQEVVVQALLEKGAKCTAVGPSGETPLHIAAQENQLACVKLLLEVGKVPVDDVTHDRSDVDAMTVDNESPLLKASRMSQFQTVKLLLSRNASTQQPILTVESFESSSNSQDTDAQLSRSRSWSSTGNGKSNKNNERVFIAKSNTHTSLKHWLRSVLNN